MRFDREHVYFVEGDPTVRLALAPELRPDGMLVWFDTLRPRMKRGAVVADEPERFVFRTSDGTTYTFRPLTLDLYNERVRDAVELSPWFSSEPELHTFYTTRFL